MATTSSVLKTTCIYDPDTLLLLGALSFTSSHYSTINGGTGQGLSLRSDQLMEILQIKQISNYFNCNRQQAQV